MFSLVLLHPMIVHLPIGLWMTTPFLFTAAYMSGSSERARLFATVGTVNLLLGSIVAALALLTGLLAASSLPLVGLAEGSLTRHIAWALVTSMVFGSMTLLRAVGCPFEAKPSASLLVCVWLFSVALVLTGHYGGTNVYGYGLGVDLQQANHLAIHRPVSAPLPSGTQP